MLKQSKITQELGNSALLTPKNTPDIHIAFKKWIESRSDFITLMYSHGDRLFMQERDGTYKTRSMQIAFDAFALNWKSSRRCEIAGHVVGGLIVGIFIAGILLMYFGAFE